MRALGRLLRLSFVFLVVGGGALAWTFRPETLTTVPPYVGEIPLPEPPAEMRVSVLHAGKMFNVAALAYRGGSFAEERVFGMDAVLVEHPRGRLLFDSGLGRDVDEHFETTPWLMQATSRYERETPVVDQLATAGISPTDLVGVVLTHAHWDHVSGLPDLQGAPVWITAEEREFIGSGHAAAALAESFSGIQWHVFDFPDGAYLGFEESFDVFDDGSVVLVPAPGHTPGSIVAFLATPDGRRFALIGDLAWQKEGVELPAERPWLTRTLADSDPAAVRRALVHFHALARVMPDLVVLPAHDRRVMRTLPAFDRERR